MALPFPFFPSFFPGTGLSERPRRGVKLASPSPFPPFFFPLFELWMKHNPPKVFLVGYEAEELGDSRNPPFPPFFFPFFFLFPPSRDLSGDPAAADTEI